MFRRFIAAAVCFTFIFSNFQYVHAQEFSINQLPMPGTMVGLSSPFAPLALKGLVVNLQKPLEFQFIVDTGKGPQNTTAIKEEANRLVKYFLAGLTIPEGDLWVNLSPYEKDRMVPDALGQTDLGRDLLAQDYILKQLTASLIYPEKDLGKEFWTKVYKKAQEQFGTTNIPVNTFNKAWILPDQAQVFENKNAAYVTKSTLKVMLDEDYLAKQKHQATQASSISSQVARQIILPEIEKEVNTGTNFAPLRQIYQALILAKWYKETVKNALLEAVYLNQKKTAGVNLNDPAVKERIYNRYLQAYKNGVFNYIKEDSTPEGQTIPRKYFSGGITKLEPDEIDRSGRQTDVKGDGAMMSLKVVLVTAVLATGIQVGVSAQTKAAEGISRSATTQVVENKTLSPKEEKEFQDLMKRAAKGSAEDRIRAVEALGRLKDKRAVPAIAQALDLAYKDLDPDPRISEIYFSSSGSSVSSSYNLRLIRAGDLLRVVARALIDIEDPTAVPALLKTLGYVSQNERFQSIKIDIEKTLELFRKRDGSLSRIVDDEFDRYTTSLIKLINDKNQTVRLTSLKAYIQIANKRSDFVPTLIPLLEDKNKLIRSEAYRGLDLSVQLEGAQNKNLLSTLIKALNDKDREIAEIAIKSIGKMGPSAKEAVFALTQIVQTSRFPVNVAAVKALGGIGPAAKEAVPVLIDALARNAAIAPYSLQTSLLQIGIDFEQIPVLMQILEKEAQASTLIRVFQTGQTSQDYSVTRNYSSIMRVALDLLEKVEMDSKSIPLLIRSLEGDDIVMRIFSAEALGRIGDERAVVPLLKTRENSSNEDMNVSVNKSLFKIGSRKPFVVSENGSPIYITTNAYSNTEQLDILKRFATGLANTTGTLREVTSSGLTEADLEGIIRSWTVQYDLEKVYGQISPASQVELANIDPETLLNNKSYLQMNRFRSLVSGTWAAESLMKFYLRLAEYESIRRLVVPKLMYRQKYFGLGGDFKTDSGGAIQLNSSRIMWVGGTNPLLTAITETLPPIVWYKEDVPILQALLKTQYSYFASVALREIEQLEANPLTQEEFLRGIKSQNFGVRYQTVHRLSFQKTIPEAYVPYLVELLKENNYWMREIVTNVLSGTKKASLGSLREELTKAPSLYQANDTNSRNQYKQSSVDASAVLGQKLTVLKSQDLGGIDLNQINVNREGKAVVVQFDPAQLNQLMQGGFEGFMPVIINITPIQSPLPLLGIDPRKEEEPLAKV